MVVPDTIKAQVLAGNPLAGMQAALLAACSSMQHPRSYLHALQLQYHNKGLMHDAIVIAC